jgi:hypothetical protein
MAGLQQEYLEGRFVEVLDMLREGGFQVLLLKGAALSRSA